MQIVSEEKNGSLNGVKLHEIISQLQHNSELHIKKWFSKCKFMKKFNFMLKSFIKSHFSAFLA